MNSSHPLPRLYLIRHGETAWSLSGQHTSRTDLALTAQGEGQARKLGERLRQITFSRVISSPRLRARQTCELTGLAATPEIEDDLREWDYGDYEGLTSAEIHTRRADWNLFVDGAPGGESPGEVLTRASGLVRRLKEGEGNIAVISHGHFLRVIAVAWTGLPLVHARLLSLSTASLGILNHEHNRPDHPVISLWNETGR